VLPADAPPAANKHKTSTPATWAITLCGKCLPAGRKHFNPFFSSMAVSFAGWQGTPSHNFVEVVASVSWIVVGSSI
jgi:hypothetical protein